MTFEQLEFQKGCNCIDGAVNDTTTPFARRFNKNVIRDIEMRTPEEVKKSQSKELTPNLSCTDLCGEKGISITEFTNTEERLNIIKETIPLAPKYKEYAIIFTLNEGAGVVKHTPKTDVPANLHHYDFYKSDEFVPGNHITNLQVIHLLSHV